MPLRNRSKRRTLKKRNFRGGSPSSNHVMQFAPSCGNVKPVDLIHSNDSVSLPIVRLNGGAIRMPAEYYGNNSGVYQSDPNLGRAIHAYGYSLPQSHGTTFGSYSGPNLGAYPDATGYQTGGGRKKKSKKGSRKKRKTNKGCKQCKGCKNCEGCKGCKECRNSKHCCDCTNCKNCENCHDCKNCVNCVNCVGCQGLKGAKNMVNVRR